MKKSEQTTVGNIDADVLAYTAGKDIVLDQALVRYDCLGTAAHVRMLSEMSVKPAVIKKTEVKKILQELGRIVANHHAGKFKITLKDQDVHLAVERTLTKQLGDVGKRVHTGRSRNDQVALDLRLYAREELTDLTGEVAELIQTLVRFGKKHQAWPMVGRTHMQPAMPSSVGLWATAFAEGLLEDAHSLVHAYELNDASPLGSAAGYGVPLPLDRAKVAKLLGFSGTLHNVIHASNARGKMEWAVLNALGGVMLTLSRMAQDLILYSMPEFGYFKLPPELCTGSSIMPNKYNPDVMEIMRAKAAGVLARSQQVSSILLSSASGYNRDIQETKEALMEGLNTTRQSVRIMTRCFRELKADRAALKAGFRPEVFATDRALELVAQGKPFRDAYHEVKATLHELESLDPQQAIALKTHEGATAGLDFEGYRDAIKDFRKWVSSARRTHRAAERRLLG